MNKIEFFTEDKTLLDMYPPKPIAEDLPDWVKKTDENINQFSVKNCPPVMDYMTGGYILYNAWEYTVADKVVNFKRGVEMESLNPRPEIRKQPKIYDGSCLPMPNGPFSYFKLETDYKVKTPPGYSCLVMSPYYHFDNKFTVLPGIIDTDKYDWVISTMAYTKEKNLHIWPGERLLQIIPFKRENWQSRSGVEVKPTKLLHYIRECYKKLFWSEKIYK